MSSENKEVVTGHWGNALTLRNRGYALVSVSRGKPKNCIPDIEMQWLAPTWNMMKMGAADYNNAYDAILRQCDPRAVWEFLPEKSALMCFEKYPKWCHRRMLAEWLEKNLGVEVTEFGYPRQSVIPYSVMCGTSREIERVSPPPGVPVFKQEPLF